jgi:hypothetical protein
VEGAALRCSTVYKAPIARARRYLKKAMLAFFASKRMIAQTHFMAVSALEQTRGGLTAA